MITPLYRFVRSSVSLLAANRDPLTGAQFQSTDSSAEVVHPLGLRHSAPTAGSHFEFQNTTMVSNEIAPATRGCVIYLYDHPAGDQEVVGEGNGRLAVGCLFIGLVCCSLFCIVLF